MLTQRYLSFFSCKLHLPLQTCCRQCYVHAHHILFKKNQKKYTSWVIIWSHWLLHYVSLGFPSHSSSLLVSFPSMIHFATYMSWWWVTVSYALSFSDKSSVHIYLNLSLSNNLCSYDAKEFLLLPPQLGLIRVSNIVFWSPSTFFP
jgi:hypothetical protein